MRMSSEALTPWLPPGGSACLSITIWRSMEGWHSGGMRDACTLPQRRSWALQCTSRLPAFAHFNPHRNLTSDVTVTTSGTARIVSPPAAGLPAAGAVAAPVAAGSSGPSAEPAAAAPLPAAPAPAAPAHAGVPAAGAGEKLVQVRPEQGMACRVCPPSPPLRSTTPHTPHRRRCRAPAPPPRPPRSRPCPCSFLPACRRNSSCRSSSFVWRPLRRSSTPR